MKKVAVIDMGSNTIKLLVASGNQSIQTHFESVEECRISQGISGKKPKLTEASMKAGKEAVGRLVSSAKEHGAADIRIVATSAVRDACNGESYANAIQKAYSYPVQILSGQLEAETIAQGLRFDPELEYLRNYIHFDLGGGSLECNLIKDRKLDFATSLPLGAVRMTEQWVKDPKALFTHEDATQIREQVLNVMDAASIPMTNELQPMVFTGGSATISRALIHNRPVSSRDLGSNILLLTELQSLLAQLSSIDFEQRLQFEYLPKNRADVVCAAIQILITTMERQEKSQFQHSLFALRHGITAEMLGLL